MTRKSKFNAVVKSVGILASEVDPLDGWPGQITLEVAEKKIKLALHVSKVSPHARKEYEWRFQNPASCPPVSNIDGTALPILIAVDNEKNPEVVVAIDGRSRLERETRFSVLFNSEIIDQARENGWAVYESNKGEKIYAFWPTLLPIFIDQIVNNENLDQEVIESTLVASGLSEAKHEGDVNSLYVAAKRTSRAVNILIRKSGFGRHVVDAYGKQCAICGIGLGLLQGAHIYPVQADGAVDEVWNGLSLCLNHHGAFDKHLIWIDPITFEIKIHPDIYVEAKSNNAAQLFVQGINEKISLPIAKKFSPKADMFLKRYSYFSIHYSWVNNLRK